MFLSIGNEKRRSREGISVRSKILSVTLVTEKRMIHDPVPETVLEDETPSKPTTKSRSSRSACTTRDVSVSCTTHRVRKHRRRSRSRTHHLQLATNIMVRDARETLGGFKEACERRESLARVVGRVPHPVHPCK